MSFEDEKKQNVAPAASDLGAYTHKREVLLAQAGGNLGDLDARIQKPANLDAVEKQKIEELKVHSLDARLKRSDDVCVLLQGWHIADMVPARKKFYEGVIKVLQQLSGGKIKALNGEIDTRADYHAFLFKFGRSRDEDAPEYLLKTKGAKPEFIGMRTSFAEIWEQISRYYNLDATKTAQGQKILAYYVQEVLKTQRPMLLPRTVYDPHSPTLLAYNVPSLKRSFAIQSFFEGSLGLVDPKKGFFLLAHTK